MFRILAAVILVFAVSLAADAACGSGSGRLGIFRQARHAFHATRHQALADHHTARHDAIQARRDARMGRSSSQQQQPEALPMPGKAN